MLVLKNQIQDRDPWNSSRPRTWTSDVVLEDITLWLWLTVCHGIDGPNRNRWFSQRTKPPFMRDFPVRYVSHNHMGKDIQSHWVSLGWLQETSVGFPPSRFPTDTRFLKHMSPMNFGSHRDQKLIEPSQSKSNILHEDWMIGLFHKCPIMRIGPPK